jgi:hypothetical protein
MREQQSASFTSSRDRSEHSPPSKPPAPPPHDQLQNDPLPNSKDGSGGGVAGLVLRGMACSACAGFVALVIAFGVTSAWWHPPPAVLAAAPADDDPMPALACQFIGLQPPPSLYAHPSHSHRVATPRQLSGPLWRRARRAACQA